jgi:acetylornithine deacetylase/succinyl-diaminopimelate desuccinylase-like protein
MTGNSPLAEVLRSCVEREADDLTDLMTLIAQPSISAQDIGIRECADLFAGLLRHAGLGVRLMPTAHHPMIYAETPPISGRPTLLVYGHYDVQPPDPLEEWISPPFSPVVRDGRIFGRGAGDNKGQILAQIAAVRAWMRTAGDTPVNVKFLIEGEEEIGSPHLDAFVAANRELLAADLVYTSDGPVHDDAHPQIVYGVRGMLLVELRARGANHDLHSGNWGGVAPNPAWTMVQLLATMRNEAGEVTIEGFDRDVRSPSKVVRAAIAAIPLDIPAALAGIGVDRLPPPGGVGYFERLMTRPTLNIAGFASGYGGAGTKTIVPARAVVKIDMRLVPDQTADQAFDAFSAHVRRYAPEVEVVRLGSMEPSFTPLDHPYAGAVRRAVAAGFGTPPVDIPLLGGSLPDAAFTRTLGLPSFLVPYANSDERNHAPNENLVVARFHAGIRTTAILLDELSRTPGPAQ